jgi:beta-phosphoglucomutase
MSLEIHALIFDMDGVITDTVELHYRAWERLTQEEGIPFTRADNDRLRGLSRRDSLSYVFRGRDLDHDAVEALMARKNRYFLELLQHMTPDDALPGVTRLIGEARAAGLKIGLASSSQNVYPVLEKLNLRATFDAIGDYKSVARTKPAPDIFIWTAGRLNINPANALVFEDSEAGVEAAQTGGFWTVGIGDQAIVGRAHLVVPDLSGASVHGLLNQLASQRFETRP